MLDAGAALAAAIAEAEATAMPLEATGQQLVFFLLTLAMFCFFFFCFFFFCCFVRRVLGGPADDLLAEVLGEALAQLGLARR